MSRSALQNDGFVQKISEYISKKVADKLTGMCKTDRESYEKYWDDISPFINMAVLKMLSLQRKWKIRTIDHTFQKKQEFRNYFLDIICDKYLIVIKFDRVTKRIAE